LPAGLVMSLVISMARTRGLVRNPLPQRLMRNKTSICRVTSRPRSLRQTSQTRRRRLSVLRWWIARSTLSMHH